VHLRELRPSTDRVALERLWQAALAPAWPLLPEGLDLVRAGLVAERDGEVVGAVAIDPAGSIVLLMVDPAWQRRSIGTTLLESAIGRLREAGVPRVHLGSGGRAYVWPGVPADLAGAVRFFERHGWKWDYRATDLTADLRGYVAPDHLFERPAAAGVRLAVAQGGDLAEALAFERSHFPQWLRFFEEGRESILLARDARGAPVGSLLFSGPGRGSVFWPMLGGDMATIGCVGVAEAARRAGIGAALVGRASELVRDAGAGTCHIGWAWRPEFYERLGYRRWRDYMMAARSMD
jgi:beta-N-acetylhexosaminidase